METNQTTAALAIIVPSIFKDIDFSGLNASIETIANNSGALTDKEKDLAVKVVENWQGSVVKRLETKADETQDFITAFDSENQNMPLDVDQCEAMAKATGTQKEYSTYLAACEALKDHDNKTPEEPLEDLNESLDDQLTAKKDYELSDHKHTIIGKKLNREKRLALKAWKIALNDSVEVKEMLTKARKFMRNVNKFKTECEDKTNMAKLNISIASPEIRASIRELLDFAVTM